MVVVVVVVVTVVVFTDGARYKEGRDMVVVGMQVCSEMLPACGLIWTMTRNFF